MPTAQPTTTKTLTTIVDPFYINKERKEPIGAITKGFKDNLFIDSAQETFEEKYLTYMKKSNTPKEKKLAKTKHDF